MGSGTSRMLRSQLSSPRDREAIERTFAGYRAGLAKMSIPQLMANANELAAKLQEQAATLTSELLSASLARNLDSPVLPSAPTDSPSPAPDRPDPASRPSSPPPNQLARSRSQRAGRRIVAGLARSGMAANARRARAEGRR